VPGSVAHARDLQKRGKGGGMDAIFRTVTRPRLCCIGWFVVELATAPQHDSIRSRNMRGANPQVPAEERGRRCHLNSPGQAIPHLNLPGADAEDRQKMSPRIRAVATPASPPPNIPFLLRLRGWRDGDGRWRRPDVWPCHQKAKAGRMRVPLAAIIPTPSPNCLRTGNKELF
jgi:hypothetical protein